MLTAFLFLAFILGTAIGSFLNVVAYRSVHGGSVFFDRSRCPRCKHKLTAFDLIPLISFLLQRGECRYCRKEISYQYPLVEAASGLLFAGTFYFWWVGMAGVTLLNITNLLFLLFAASVLLVLFVTDITDGLLPNSIVVPSIAVIAAYEVFLLVSGSVSITNVALDFLAAFIAAALFFAIVYFSHERAMGGGDVKLVFLIGIFVGWPALTVALFASFLTGAFVAVMLILIGKRRFGQTVPFGPFLAIGAVLALFWGQEIIDLYLGTLSG